MNRSSFAIGSVLALLACQSSAQSCTSTIDPSPSFLRKVDRVAANLQTALQTAPRTAPKATPATAPRTALETVPQGAPGTAIGLLPSSQAVVEKFTAMSLMSARTRWTCTVGTEDACCKNIPVTILEDSEGKQCAASFPYSELVIKRNGGSFKPKVSWKLQQTVPTPPAYVFGSAGIEVTPIGSTPLPVETTGPDRCHYNGTQDRFVCKGTGRRLAKADHVANVYKTGFMDDPLYRCGNVDPTIISTD